MSATAGPGPGLAIESATDHVEVAVFGAAGEALALRAENLGHGHTRRLTALCTAALAEAGIAPGALRWLAPDLGPGSFTGVRVGIATAQALAMVAGAELRGASSLAALAWAARGHGLGRALLVPMVPAGRRDAYAGFFRLDSRGIARRIAAPVVGPPEAIRARADELREVLGGAAVCCIGPGAARWREALEAMWPGATTIVCRDEGLSAVDLALAARSGRGPAAGLPAEGEGGRPAYVRSAQAEERVRREIVAREPIALRAMVAADVPALVAIEQQVFSDPWSASFFRGELGTAGTWARIAERQGALAGYLVAWLGEGQGHLGNIAVVPGQRRRGVAHALLRELLTESVRQSVRQLTLEVRASNDVAQVLYREHGFHAVGLRRAYYQDTGEDALVMGRDPFAGGT